jgi:hypothetical protein
MSIDMETMAGGVAMRPPYMHIPDHDLQAAAISVSSAIRQLQAVQEVQWQSSAAFLFRRELFGLIRHVREVERRVDVAMHEWDALQAVARSNGQW